MNCLYCGKEVWLPSRIRRDPDFCTPDHREKYNNRVDLAMRRIEESSPLGVYKPAPTPVMETPPSRTPSRETGSAPYGNAGTQSPALIPVYSNPNSPAPESSDPPVVTAAIPSASAERHLDTQPSPVAPQPSLSEDLLQLNVPRMVVRPVFERLKEEDQTTHHHDLKPPAFTQIFSMPDAAAITRRKVGRHAIKAIAASVTVAMALWVGGSAAKFGKDLLSQSASEIPAPSPKGSDPAGALEVASTLAPTGRPEPSALRHPVDWVMSAAARRATTQLAESFGGGMAAWSITSNGWAPGWSRSPDGYVHPGQLALFQPSLDYADYRMDFFGEIEKNSMSWVIRGKDTQNYYAMKMNILRPGLRPVLSMVHYPVVHGKQGHKVELPLSVMIHNGMPYHVSVEVRGDHYTAAIEGEEVDSWSDDTLLAGGVGFFSETGDRARIYWMKVSQNDDWLGRLCGHIASGGEAHNKAWLERLAPPLPPVPAMAALWR